MNTIKAKIEAGMAKLGVIGLGYVGLPLAVAFAKAGFDVIGFDLSEKKLASIAKGESYINDVSSAELREVLDGGHFKATSDMSLLADVDSVNICVPTPLSKTKDPDISYIQSAVNSIARHMHTGMLIILESTTYPGTTEEIILPIIEETGFTVGDDFFLAFSPERVDPGNKEFQTVNIPKIVGGVTDSCREVAVTLYSKVMDKVIPVSSVKVAETVKLLENTFRSVNIGLVNEIALMCSAMDIDVWEVIDGASTKPFGYMPFYPGPGLGGHCIPIDPFYLAWKAKLFGFDSKFIELAGQVNGNMPKHVINLLIKGLNEKSLSVRGSKILVVGVSYKAGIEDVRESPALDIIQMIDDLGGELSWYDPHVKSLPEGISGKRITEWDTQTLGTFSAIVITTPHPDVDHSLTIDTSAIIIDTRNALKNFDCPRIIKL